MTKESKEGRDAYLSGAHITANPYEPLTQKFRDWGNAWRDAREADMLSTRNSGAL